MHVVKVLNGNMQLINTHFSGVKPTFAQLVEFKNRYEDAEFVTSDEVFADFELREGERKERLAYEQKQAELERIKREQDATRGQAEGGTN
ncbi:MULTISPECIES: hypothetical protein [Bacillus cereus group]|uniref:Uncharacterized protein n=2 Tax=root TaxID=1 RepID=A0A8E8PBG7_9VIRU|nr:MULTISPECIES: hypothetical protein [Bacillus cereus group]YP_010771386.1 hypothetical protein QIM33_gp16 [Bacillus phage Sole]MDA2052250.1 hypothetical protein [Bacillus cereus]EJR71087.1 hypothetical protein IK9_06097 [Bacillus cereus VD166]OUB78260.1 hypothetical protein BK750_00395 [Bacillus thuringiensis serovar jegathesan]QWE49668.1 hypothetical protein Sole_gp16 [Bacillus phage Sole]